MLNQFFGHGKLIYFARENIEIDETRLAEYGLLRFWVEFLMGSAIFVCGIPHGISFEFIHVKLVPYGVY